MATLAETLRKKRDASQGNLVRGQAGSLSSQSTEEIQSLSNKAGLASPPLTPIGAAAVGANADQQKMMGSPAQKEAALSLAMKPQQGLSGALRQQQSRTQLTAEEEQAKQKSVDMQNLGGLGERVSSFIDAQRAKLQQQSSTPVQVASSASYQDKDLTPIAGVLEQLRADPQNMQLQLQVNEFLGRDVNSVIAPEEIDQLYETATQSISKGGAAVIDDSLSVAQLVSDPQFGYDVNTLSQLLGVAPEQLQGMTVGQLKAEVNRAADEEFSRSQQQLQQAESGLLGQVERNVARQEGRELSATGVRSTEAAVADLENQIANADEVQFGGKTYKVDELLQDETITDVITEYMNSSPDDPFRKQLEESEPALLEFINKNKDVLEQASKQLQAGATGFRTIQDTNTSNLSLKGQLPDEVASQLFPQYKKLASSAVDINEIPLLAAGQNAGPQYAQSINQIVQTDPELTPELKELSIAEIKALGLDNPSGQWKAVQDNRNMWDKYENAQSTVELANAYFNQNLNPDLITRAVGDSRVMSVLGYADPGQLRVLDNNGDGTPDTPEQIRASLQNGAKPSLRDGITGRLNVAQNGSFSLPDPNGLRGNKAELFNRLRGPMLSNNGQVTPDIISQSFPVRGTTADNKKELDLLNDLSRAPGINPAGLAQIQTKKREIVNKQGELISSDSSFSPFLDWYKSNQAASRNGLNPQYMQMAKTAYAGQLLQVLEDSRNNPDVTDTFRSIVKNKVENLLNDAYGWKSKLLVNPNIYNELQSKAINDWKSISNTPPNNTFIGKSAPKLEGIF